MSNLLFDALLGDKASNVSPFLVNPGSSSISYAAFFEKVARTANALTRFGVKPGDRVTVAAEKSEEALALYFASIGVGAIFAPLNTQYTATELEYFIQDAKPALIVCGSAKEATLQLVGNAIGASVATLDQDGKGTLEACAALMPGRFEPVAREKDDLAAILYTSGTTGPSKGATLTHWNLLSNARALMQCWRVTDRDVLLHALPIFHAHGLFVAVNTVALAGGAMIFHPRFSLDDVIRNLPDSTVMMGIPTFYTRLLSDKRFDRALNSAMRLFISGSAPLLAATHNDFEQRTGHRILERYGMTETVMITSNPYDRERKAGSVGLPLPGVKVRICEQTAGTVLEPGQTGVLEVSGPNVFQGYWGKPEQTEQAFRKDGYFITGDLAVEDEAGYILIVGRDKDLIISGGYNIYPKEVELLIDALDSVVESAVIGVPHADFGEAVVAIVVTKEGNQPTEDGLVSQIAPNLAKFKHPKRVAFLKELPRNSMGKVQKASLREEFGTLFKEAT